VRSRIDDTVRHIIVGQEGMGCQIPIKGKLENAHPGKPKAIHHVFHLLRDQSEVFSNECLCRELLKKGCEKVMGRSLNPLAPDGRFFRRSDFPVGDKAPEVVDAQDIKELKIVAYPFEPPLVPRILKGVPSIDRVSPELSCLAEVIRRNTCNKGGPLFSVQLKEVRMRPYIGTIVIDVDRNITDQLQPFLVAVFFKGEPLFKEKKLKKFLLF